MEPHSGADSDERTVVDADARTVHDDGQAGEGLAGGASLGQRYEPIGRLGAGGMGEVLRVFDRTLRREVALKRLASDVADRVRFLAEAQLTAQLSHDNIVPLYDVGDLPDGDLYVTMKLVEGGNLRSVLEGHQRAPSAVGRDRFVRLLVDVARGLAHAHARGVVHRDLKPENVMLGEDGRAMVMDWGLAKVVGVDLPEGGDSSSVEVEAGVRSRAGSVMGTLYYMSPEQAAGEVDRIDATTDVWALGVMLYELLTGRFPFPGPRAREVLTAIGRDDPPAPGLVARNVPPELEAIALKCLARERAGRYGGAEDVARDLVRYLEGRSVSARPDGSLRALYKLARRHPLVLSIGAVGLAVGGVVVVRDRIHEDRVAAAEDRRAEVGQAVDEAIQAGYWARDRTMADEVEVRRRFEALIERIPDHPVPWRLRGIWYHDHRYEGIGCRPLTPTEVRARARDDLERALVLDADDRISLVYLTFLALEENDPERTLAWIERLEARGEDSEFHPFAGAWRLAESAREETDLNVAQDLRRRAVALLDEAIERNPAFALAYLFRGSHRTVLGDLGGALDDLDRALEAFPDHPIALEAKGAALYRADLAGAAIFHLLRATQIAPGRVAAWSNLGVALLGEGRLEEALRALDRAIDLDPDHVRARTHRGETLLALGRRQEAMASFDLAVEASGGDPELLLLRATARRQGGDPSGALVDLDRVVERDPRHAAGHALRAVVLGDLGRLEEAIDAATLSIGIEPRRMAYMARGSAQLKARDHERAEADFGRAAELDPDHPEAYFARGKARTALARFDGALADLDRALELRPGDPSVHEWRGQVHGFLGRSKEAAADLEKAVAGGIDRVSTHYNLGFARLQLQDGPGARRAFDRALELDPDHVRSRYWRGMVLSGEGEDRLARRDFDRVLALDPDHADALLQRALVLRALGEPGAAAADLRHLLDVEPDHPQRQGIEQLIEQLER